MAAHPLRMLTLLTGLFLAVAPHAEAQSIAASSRPMAQPPTKEPPTAISRPVVTSPASLPPAGNSKSLTPKDPSTATLAAVGCTLGGALLGGLAVVGTLRDGPAAGFLLLDLTLSIGPSCGHFYAGETKHALLTTSLRFVSYGLGELLIINAVINNVEYPRDPEAASSQRMMLGVVLVAVGLGLTIYDIMDAGPAATRSNERRGLVSLHPVPLLTPKGAGSTVGLALAGRF